jgi:hypothetical protein
VPGGFVHARSMYGLTSSIAISTVSILEQYCHTDTPLVRNGSVVTIPRSLLTSALSQILESHDAIQDIVGSASMCCVGDLVGSFRVAATISATVADTILCPLACTWDASGALPGRPFVECSTAHFDSACLALASLSAIGMGQPSDANGFQYFSMAARSVMLQLPRQPSSRSAAPSAAPSGISTDRRYALLLIRIPPPTIVPDDELYEAWMDAQHNLSTLRTLHLTSGLLVTDHVVDSSATSPAALFCDDAHSICSIPFTTLGRVISQNCQQDGVMQNVVQDSMMVCTQMYGKGMVLGAVTSDEPGLVIVPLCYVSGQPTTFKWTNVDPTTVHPSGLHLARHAVVAMASQAAGRCYVMPVAEMSNAAGAVGNNLPVLSAPLAHAAPALDGHTRVLQRTAATDPKPDFAPVVAPEPRRPVLPEMLQTHARQRFIQLAQNCRPPTFCGGIVP